MAGDLLQRAVCGPRGVWNLCVLEQQIKAVRMKCKRCIIGSDRPFYISFKEWQNIFNQNKVLQARQHFCSCVEQVVQADNGYSEGPCHNH